MSQTSAGTLGGANPAQSSSHLAEAPGELHVLAGGVAALQQPRPAVDVHQTLVVVVVDGGTQDPQVELLGAGVVDILRAERQVKVYYHCYYNSVPTMFPIADRDTRVCSTTQGGVISNLKLKNVSNICCCN